MKKFLNYLLLPFKYLLLLPLYIYKFFISPCLMHVCRFTPSCSSYMIEAIKEFGAFKGIFLGIKRLSRCTPKHEGGFDPVPVNLKGDKKWIF